MKRYGYGIVVNFPGNPSARAYPGIGWCGQRALDFVSGALVGPRLLEILEVFVSGSLRARVFVSVALIGLR